MNSVMTYSGRQITTEDINIIKNIIKENPGKSRRYISKAVCQAWNWHYNNGALKDMVCRSLLNKLEKSGLIVQPPRKFTPNNPLANRKPPKKIVINTIPLKMKLKDMLPIEILSVRKSKYEKLYNSLIHEYHYLKFTYPVGENIKYIAFYKNRPIGCLGWTSAAWHIGCRDRYIGWDKKTRIKNLKFIAYNTRFLILPFIKVKYLASHLLSVNAKMLSKDWQINYNHPIYYIETFVDTQRGYKGTCYKASNWTYLGKTTGRGKLAPDNKKRKSIKDVYGMGLCKNFREKLKEL